MGTVLKFKRKPDKRVYSKGFGSRGVTALIGYHLSREKTWKIVLRVRPKKPNRLKRICKLLAGDYTQIRTLLKES